MPPDQPSSSTPSTAVRIGIDIGGTFTDFVVFHPATGLLQTFKLLSTPQDPSLAVLQGITQIRAALPGDSGLALHIIHGSTVATNALLERKGARAAFVATRGFADLLQIGRQDRPELYDFFADPSPPLVQAELRFEVDERVNAEGDILVALDPDSLDDLIDRLGRQPVDSVAVCLLFSFLRTEHEQVVAARLLSAGYWVTHSSDVLPEFREYERASTTAVNAYVSPVLDRYLARLEAGVNSEMGALARLRVMQSNGGNISVGEARRYGVRCILSGPAGGVVGCQRIAAARRAAQAEPSVAGDRIRLITFDMGGTSTDVSLIDGVPQVTTEAVVGGCPIRIPILDIHTIGAGGGSLALVDPGGALRVGPESAGADPGPACYGRGDRPTVTDANLVLGRLDPHNFLGGQMPLVASRAEAALSRLGDQLRMDARQAALGVIEVANAHMERALRIISVERGYDPRDFSLLSFGGAGGLHAAGLARRLGIPRLVVPPLASTLSAFGMLAADVVKDYTLTVMLPGDTLLDELSARIAPLLQRAAGELQVEGIPPAVQRLERLLDLRYRGQSYELPVVWAAAVGSTRQLLDAFHALHERTYGYSQPASAVEIVNLRVRATGPVSPPPLPALPPGGADASPALRYSRPVVFGSASLNTPFYQGEDLRPGNQVNGPAIVLRADTTILIDTADRALVDEYGNLVIQVGL